MRLGRFFLGRGFFSAVIVAISVIAATAYTAAAAYTAPVPLPSVAHAAKPRVQIIAAITAKTVKNSLFFIFRLLKNKVKIFYHSIR